MEDFNPTKVRPDTQIIAEVNKEYTFKGSIRKKRGLILFAVFPSDNYRCERVVIQSSAEIVANTKDNTSRVENKHKAFFKEDANYIWAINEETAVKKIKRNISIYLQTKFNKMSIEEKTAFLQRLYNLNSEPQPTANAEVVTEPQPDGVVE